jgi:hypothetical protein
MSHTQLQLSSEQITIHIKNMAGDVFNLVTRRNITPKEFPFFVFDILPEPRPHIAFLRFFHEGKEEEEFLPDSHDHQFQDNELFHLFVAEPELNVCFHKEDNAVEYGQEPSDLSCDFEFYRVSVTDIHHRTLLDTKFYVHTRFMPIHHDEPQQFAKFFTDVFYREADVEVIDNPSPATRHNGGPDERTISICHYSMAEYGPGYFAIMTDFPRYHSLLIGVINREWEAYAEELGLYIHRIQEHGEHYNHLTVD